MTAIRELKGILYFTKEAWDDARLQVGELSQRYLVSPSNRDDNSSATIDQFLVTLTFAEKKGRNPVVALQKALQGLLTKLTALRVGPPVVTSAGGAVIVELLRLLMQAGQDADVDEAARAIRRMDEDKKHPDVTNAEKLPEWRKFEGWSRKWRDAKLHDFSDQETGQAEYDEFIDELRKKLDVAPEAPEQGSFELTQLVGWIEPGSDERTYNFQLRGSIKHAFGEYAPGARLDVLGPDGSQLVTEYIQPRALRRQILTNEIDKVTVGDADELLRALRAREEELEKKARARIVRGRILRSDGAPLGVRSLAIFAPPAFACELDPCCGDMDVPDGCCQDDTRPSVLRVPVALAVTDTDEAGYFDFTYSEPELGLDTPTVLINLSGAQASLAVQLEPFENAGVKNVRHRFPEPLLIPCQAELLAPLPELGDLFDVTDLEDDQGCRGLQLDQSSRALEEYEHLVFLRTSDPAVTVSRRADAEAPASASAYFRVRLDRGNRARWDEDAGLAQAETIAHGRILTFKQIWRADGYSLGDLLYSLPLAPLQKKNIAVVDWDRQESIRVDSRQENYEALRNELSRDRDISEIIRSTLEESTRGSSSSGSSASSGSSGLFGAIFGGSSGGGSSAWSNASQESSRSLATNFLNQLRDRTNQAANSLRSQRVTSVQQVSQSERSTATSETVANRNACHAITIQYFEVLRHFRVDYELAAVREAIFVPLPIEKFDSAKALRWRPNLEGYLPSPGLFQGLDALSRLHAEPPFNYPAGLYSDEPVLRVWGELVVSASTPLPVPLRDATQYATAAGYEWLDAFPAEMEELIAQEKGRRGAWFEERITPLLLRKLASHLQLRIEGVNSQDPPAPVSADAALTLLSIYREGGQQKMRLRVAADLSSLALTRANLAAIRVEYATDWPDTWAIKLTELDLRYVSSVIEHRLVSTRSILGDTGWVSDPNGNFVRLATPTTEEERRNAKKEDEASARRLVDHLNQNLEFYHKAIWWTMDADRRYALLDGFVAPNSGGRSVASVVENRLVGIVGNSLVMPVAPGTRLDKFDESVGSRSRSGTSGRGTNIASDSTVTSASKGAPDGGGHDARRLPDLLSLYRPSIANPSTRISVPTRGVFAESVIGGCNGCEKIDDSRNWRYWEHPLPDQPTEIDPLSTASRGTPVPFNIPQLANSPIQQAGPLEAPPPTDLERILSILKAADTFRDMAGLAGTQANAQDALRASFETTQKAYEIATNALMEGAKAAASAYTGMPIGDASKLKSAIGRDVKAGRITAEQGRDSISKVNDVMTEALAAKSPKTLLEHPDVAGAIGAAAVRGASLSLERGDTKIDVGPAPGTSPVGRGTRLPWPLRLLTPASAEAAETAPFSFRALSEAYPIYRERADLFAKLGGEWPSLVGRPEYSNTCAIRISVALKKVGVTIPRAFREAMEGDGSPLIIKVATLDRFLNQLLGPPAWHRSKRGGEVVHPPSQTGIITYRANFGLATGHFDLWTGSDFLGPAGDHGDMAYSNYVALWPVR